MEPTQESMELDDMLAVLIPAGFPTFDQFKKDPDKYRVAGNHLFESADASTITLRKALSKQKYCWRNEYKCKSLEQLETIAKNEGYSVDDLEMQPKVYSLTGTNQEDIEIVVHFWPKDEFAAMGGIVANAQE